MFPMSNKYLNQLIKEALEEALEEIITENYHYYNKDYRLYEGNNEIVAIFEDNSRLGFRVHYRNTHGSDRDKHRKKAMSKWKSLASKIHSNIEYNEMGNKSQKSWKESFEEALQSPELKEFVRTNERDIYDAENDKSSASLDSVNFTPRV